MKFRPSVQLLPIPNTWNEETLNSKSTNKLIDTSLNPLEHFLENTCLVQKTYKEHCESAHLHPVAVARLPCDLYQLPKTTEYFCHCLLLRHCLLVYRQLAKNVTTRSKTSQHSNWIPINTQSCIPTPIQFLSRASHNTTSGAQVISKLFSNQVSFNLKLLCIFGPQSGHYTNPHL